MKLEFYQVEWENGNTDVFADLDDALNDWRKSNTKNDKNYGKYLEEEGFYTSEPSSLSSIWSVAAMDKAKRHGMNIE